MAKDIKFTIKLNVDGRDQFGTVTASAKDLTKALDDAKSKATRLQDAMVKFSSISTVVKNTGEALGKLSAKMSELRSKNLAMQQQTGLTGDAMAELRDEVQAVATTYGKDFSEVLSGASTMMKGFGISSEEAMKLVRGGLMSGADATGQMFDILKEYPAYFKEAGLTAEQFMAIITNGANMGVFNDKAADTIKEGNLRLREMTKATTEALDGIGLDSEKIQEQLKSGMLTTFDVMQQVGAKLKELPQTSAEVGTAIADIFGGNLYLGSSGSTIGKIKLSWDSANKALAITNVTTGETMNVYATGGVSAYGVGVSSSSSGGGLNGSVVKYTDAISLETESLDKVASAYSVAALYGLINTNTSSITSLQSSVSAVSSNLSAEITRAKNAESALTTSVNGKVSKSGDTMTGALTVNSSVTVGSNLNVTSGTIVTRTSVSNGGIKLGDTYLSSIRGSAIFQNNTAIRFGGSAWDWDVWAGLKYEPTTKTIHLGLADGSVFAANNAQSGGILNLPGIKQIKNDTGDLTLRGGDNVSLQLADDNSTWAIEESGISIDGSIGEMHIYADSDDETALVLSSGNYAYLTGGNPSTYLEVKPYQIFCWCYDTAILECNPGGVSVEGTLNVSNNIAAKGNVTAYSSSDRRKKTNIVEADSLALLKQLGKTYEFDYKESGEHSVGFMAQDIKEGIFSDLVAKDEEGYLKINYWSPKLIAATIGAVNIIDDEVEQLKKRVKELEGEVERLKTA